MPMSPFVKTSHNTLHEPLLQLVIALGYRVLTSYRGVIAGVIAL